MSAGLTCPDCGGPWQGGACAACGLSLEDLEGAGVFLDRLLDQGYAIAEELEGP
jgi:hypothetical protein